MKNILLVAMIFSAFAGMSEGLTLSKRFDELYKNRIAFAFGSGFHHVGGQEKRFPEEVYGLGMESLYGRLFQAIELLPGFELLSSSTFGFASKGKAFHKYPIKDLQGFYVDAELGFRYLHKMTEDIDFGGSAVVGYGMVFARYLNQLYDVRNTEDSNMYLLYPLHVSGGLALRYSLASQTTLYGSLLYTLKDIGDNDSATWLTKDLIGHFNKHGVALPFGAIWTLNKNVGFFSEIELAFRDLSSSNLGFKAGIDIGISFDFTR